MTVIIRLTLMCVLFATSLGLGAARGQLMQGVTVELCAGGSITVAIDDATGTPIRHSQLCPDMATVLLAGFDAPPTLPPRTEGAVSTVRPAQLAPVLARVTLTPQARGPPAFAIS